MKTAFVHARVDVGAGLSLVVDGNSKITAGNGSYTEPRPNAFSLPAASVSGPRHCPGSTPSCRASCYVHGLAKHAPDVYAAYQLNAETLRALLNWPGPDGYESANRLGAWIAANAPHGFRWHVSGDVWHEPHAAWIVRVAWASRGVRHWIYTRTLEVVPLLCEAGNLTVNVSADADNYEAASLVAATTGARLAYMCRAGEAPPELPAGSVIFPDYPLRGRELANPAEHPWWMALDHRTRLQVCPADFFGQSEAQRCGPCDKCIRPSRGAVGLR